MNGVKVKNADTRLLTNTDQDPAPPDLYTMKSSATLQSSVRNNKEHSSNDERSCQEQNSFKNCNCDSQNMCFSYWFVNWARIPLPPDFGIGWLHVSAIHSALLMVTAGCPTSPKTTTKIFKNLWQKQNRKRPEMILLFEIYLRKEGVEHNAIRRTQSKAQLDKTQTHGTGLMQQFRIDCGKAMYSPTTRQPLRLKGMWGTRHELWI